MKSYMPFFGLLALAILTFSSCERRDIKGDSEENKNKKLVVAWDWKELSTESIKPSYLSLVANTTSATKPEYVEKVVGTTKDYPLAGTDFIDLGLSQMMGYYAEGSPLSTLGPDYVGNTHPADAEGLTFSSTSNLSGAQVRLLVSDKNGQPTAMVSPASVYAATTAEPVTLASDQNGTVTLVPKRIGRRVNIEITCLSEGSQVVRSECYLGGLPVGAYLFSGNPVIGVPAVRQYTALVQNVEPIDGRTVSDGTLNTFGIADDKDGGDVNILEVVLYLYKNDVPHRFTVDMSKLIHDSRWDRMDFYVKYSLDDAVILESSASLYHGNEYLIDM